jgi:asparagine synthase (glutamine-hydrolysing)
VCGIAGFVGQPAIIAELRASNAIDRMLDRLGSRGPDGRGEWSDSRAILGHTRLAVRDQSAAASQPICSPSGRFVVLYNGNILNVPELTSTLSAWPGKSTQDTLALAYAIDQVGVPEAISRIDGMYAIVVWDRTTQSVWLARDPSGLKPLIYGRVGGAFWFGSTLHALLGDQHLEKNLLIDIEALTLAVRMGCVPAPMTVYKDIFKLMPGEVRHHTATGALLSSIEVSAAREVLFGVSAEDQDEAINHLGECVKAATISSTASDRPLGLLLSGGVDSSLLASILAPLECLQMTYTVGSDDSFYDEAEAANQVTGALGLPSSIIRPTEGDIRSIVSSLWKIYDEPLGDPSMIPTCLLCRVAAQDVGVALCGDGADELFGGYGRQHALVSLFREGEFGTHNFWESRSETIGSLNTRLASWLGLDALSDIGSLSLIEAYDAIIATGSPSLFIRPTKTWGAFLALPVEAIKSDSVLRACRTLDLALYFPNVLSVKMDRASMAYGLEVRPPLLSRTVVSAAAQLHDDALVRAGSTKAPLRSFLAASLPLDISQRAKRGFSPPLKTWLRGCLFEWAEDTLHSADTFDLGLNREALFSLWRDHVRGLADHTRTLWPALTTLDWLRHRREAGARSLCLQ